jgi:tetratricopeptide (TPR) repeat protein
MDTARAAISRLDVGRHPEDNAANLVESWDAVQSALRAIAGVTMLSGQALIREARTRNLLSLDHAHVLVEFSSAAERAREVGYEVTDRDIEAARAGFLVFESVAQSPAPASPAERHAPPSPPAPEAETPAPVVVARAPWYRRPLIWGVAAVLLVVAGGATWFTSQARRGPAHLRRGITAYQQGDMLTAAAELTAASQRMPKAALPHIYLARMAREAGNPAAAVSELTTAIQLEPTNALALREMGAHQLALGDLELARKFYVRALEQDATDRVALGYLACTLARLGRIDEAQRFHQRAGPGDWNVCLGMVAPPPGAVAPPR